MPPQSPEILRTRIDAMTYADEGEVLRALVAEAALAADARARISARGAALTTSIRASAKPGLMEVFLAEYGLSTDEGVALMCLAEALLRVPDAETIDALIEDKIAPSDWGRHLGHSSSSLVNASTWALMLTGRVLDDPQPGLAGTLRGALKRLGEPVIRAATARAMREMGRQFVLGEDIAAAMRRAADMERQGYGYSYDMLGEAARTEADAERYRAAYSGAIDAIARKAAAPAPRDNPGISVKFSALHPRYEEAQRDRVLQELVPRVRGLARQAARANIGFNVDAEEADRLSLSLDVIAAVARDTELAGWDGFGVVVQAFGQRAGAVIDWLHALAATLDRRFMVRLVKGAYWDSEIKRAQVAGLPRFPVFTTKPATDVSYIANARKLLSLSDRIYPQFATHNAHTTAAILDMAQDKTAFEFQRLHGMGERLHAILKAEHGTRCRIYAPVGAHKDLLAYLVRRLLENGANSSFVNQIVDEDVPPEVVAADPFAALEGATSSLRTGCDLFLPERANSRGWDIAHRPTLAMLDGARDPFRAATFRAAPLIDGPVEGSAPEPRYNPADPSDLLGELRRATAGDVQTALGAARPWEAPVAERARILNHAADLMEQDHGRLFALATREAGKTLGDGVAELREAVDFLRYYAARAARLDRPAQGVFACISPWNFPLAIFAGQVAGALAAGNGVLAKPAEQTPLIAHRAVELLHRAGVPRAALQLLPGDGATVGAALTGDARVGGVAFTGSTGTARLIRSSMAGALAPGAPLIAETGGLNAMIVDSTALPEQAVRDVIQSAFQSAGQRCSALRCLYVQEDIAESFKEMLFGAMEALTLGDPWALSSDVGPVIDETARAQISAYIAAARHEGRVLKSLDLPGTGCFVPPTVIGVTGITALEREVFGPVLHLASYRAEDLDRVIEDINATGYGLTFGLHTRIDDRVQHVTERLSVGNVYVNRNQIGAIVGSQPFGGEGLSGTGPKAGGPEYLTRFVRPHPAPAATTQGPPADAAQVRDALARATRRTAPVSTRDLPGPTGESNRLSCHARPALLCLGPGEAAAHRQKDAIEALGGVAILAPDLPAGALVTLPAFGGAVFWGEEAAARDLALALARRDGAILPLVTGMPTTADALLERHLCIDTTASGGNAELLAAAGSA